MAYNNRYTTYIKYHRVVEEVAEVKIDTLIKLGSLAFGVARDEKVQELFKIAHKGAKRRGLLELPPPPQTYSNQSRVPFQQHWRHGRTPFR